MNTTNTTTDELHDDATVQKETLGEVSDTLASTDFDEEKEILPSTEVKDILPMVEPEVVKES